MATIHVVSWNTESGDRGVLGHFSEKPTDEHLTALFKDLMPDEFIGEGDDERRLVFWTVVALKPMKLPMPVPAVPSI